MGPYIHKMLSTQQHKEHNKKEHNLFQDFSSAALGWFRYAMPTLVAIAIVGGLSVHIMTSSRMCFAGARNGHMPELLAHINVKCMSPMPSLMFLVSFKLLFFYFPFYV